jgi:predicted RNase H-like nuclease (RuvC/YqgF family)
MTGTEIISILIALIVSSGALAFVLRFGTRMALAERDATNALKKTEQHTKEIGNLDGKVGHMEAVMEDIKKHLAKLDGLEEIRANVQSMKQRLDETLEEVVPRSELELRLKQSEEQVDDLKEEVRRLHNKQKP